MSFREDESRARKDYFAENSNAFRQIAFNILKAEHPLKVVFLINNLNVYLTPLISIK